MTDRLSSARLTSEIARPINSMAAWDLLLFAVVVQLLVSVGRVHQLFPALDVLRPGLVSAALGLALIFVFPTAGRSMSRLRQPITYLILAGVVLVVWSVPFSLHRRGSLEFVLQEYWKTAVIFLLVASAVRHFRDAERLAIAYLASAVIYSLIALTRFTEVSGRLDDLYMYDANDLALLLVTATPIGIYVALHARHLAARSAGMVSLGVLTVALVRTGSRGGFLAGVAVLVLYLAWDRSVTARARAVVTGALVAVVMLFAQGWYWDQMRTLLTPSQDYNLTSPYGRKAIWTRGVYYMLERPLTGVGVEQFSKAEGTLSEESRRRAAQGLGIPWTAPHNSFIQIGAELGVAGLLVFVALIVTLFATLFRFGRAPPSGNWSNRPHALAFALSASVLAFAVGGFFLSHAYSALLYTLAGLAVGLLSTLPPGAPESVGPRTRAMAMRKTVPVAAPRSRALSRR